MKLYGLTGGPGTGKSAAASMFATEGVAVTDTDDIARDVVKRGEAGLAAVAAEFGDEVLAADGGLDRATLAAKVFSEPAARLRLESILHPLIRERWLRTVEEWRVKGLDAGVVVVPLLFETKAEQHFERVICIGCSGLLQSARLQERGWTASQATGRLAAQWPLEKKMDRSDFVIWNDSSLEVLREQLGRIPPLNSRQKPAGKTID